MKIPDEITQRIFSRNRKERKRLEGKELVQVGLGSLGSALSAMAVRTGIDRFTLCDDDELVTENIGRHMCDLTALGISKAEAVSDLISCINPTAQVQTIIEDFRLMDSSGLALSLGPRSLIVDTTDSFACHSQVNQISLETRTPALYVNCWNEATIGEILYVVPGKTPCYECYAGFRRETEDLPRNDPRKYTDLTFDETRVPGQAGLWPNILVISGFAFQIILALLSGDKKRKGQFIDYQHTLFLVNVADFDSPLPLWAVTPAKVRRGCAVCDDSYLSQLGAELL